MLDSLRQPLETGKVDVARANAHVTYPAMYNDRGDEPVPLRPLVIPRYVRRGHAAPPITRARSRARCSTGSTCMGSGKSRIDLALPLAAEGSEAVAAVTQRAVRNCPRRRSRGTTNAELDGEALENWASPDRPGRDLLMQAATAMRLSARSYTRMLRVARTIADLAGAEQVGRIHVAEALSYRRQAPRA